MAVLYRRQGKEEKALAMYKMSLNIYVKEYGPDHSSVGTTNKNMAVGFKSKDTRREKINR